MYRKYKKLGWDIFTKNEGNFKRYYIGKITGEYNEVRAYLLAFMIHKDNDYNGHRDKVIEDCIESFIKEEYYNPVWFFGGEE